MSKSTKFTVAVLIAAALASSGCSVFKKGARPKTPVLGQRIPVLTSEGNVEVDPATKALPFSLPAATENSSWTESGGNATNSMGHLALGNALRPAFSVQAGRGSSLTARLAAPPIVANGRVYTMDTLGAVRAFDARTGQNYWASQTPDVRGNEAALYGGGIAYDNGRIFATNGLGFVAALSEQNGGIIWRAQPGGPLRGAPTVSNGAVYVISQDNQIYSLKESDGSTNWSEAASVEIAGLFGAASPAVGQGTVVAGFSSGELNGYG
jgi:outer membrane protein assembly factor BamB